MITSKNHLWLLGIVCLFLAVIFFSGRTLSSYPPLNSDEIDNAHTANHLRESGHIASTLMNDLIDPKFQELNSVDPGSLRGVYLRVLGGAENLLTLNPSRLRFFSLALSLGTGILLSLIGAGAGGYLAGMLAGLFWVLAPDVHLASHLIRPDSLLTFILGLMLLIYLENRIPFSGPVTFFLGLASAASLGIHPHALLLMVFVAGLTGVEFRQNGFSGRSLFHLLAGTLAGLLIFSLTADWPAYSLSRFSYIHKLFLVQKESWLIRVQPWTLLKSYFQLMAHPSTYYLDIKTLAVDYSQVVRSGPFILSFLVLLWPFKSDSKLHKDTRQTLRLGLLVSMLGLSVGRIRNEFIYINLITIFTAPLSALALTDLLGRLKTDHWKLTRNNLAPFFVGGYILAVWGQLSASTYRLQQSAYPQNARKEVRNLIGPNPGRVAGPSQFWFDYGDMFRSTDALLLNYYYSGKPQARDALVRFKPDYLIVDENFIRRALFKKMSGATMEVQPLDQFLGIQVDYLGGVPPDQSGQSRLAIYRLLWKDEGKSKKSA